MPENSSDIPLEDDNNEAAQFLEGFVEELKNLGVPVAPKNLSVLVDTVENAHQYAWPPASFEFGTFVRSAFLRFEELLASKQFDAWPQLEAQEQYLKRQLKEVDHERNQLAEEVNNRGAPTDRHMRYIRRLTENEYVFKLTLYALQRQMRHFSQTGEPLSLTEEEEDAITSLGGYTGDEHLDAAVTILRRHPELKTFDDFYNAAREMSEELGLTTLENPGDAIRRGLARRIKATFGEPAWEGRFDGFRKRILELAGQLDI